MMVNIELEKLKLLENTLAELPRAPLIEQWGLIFVCYNTIKQLRAEAESEQAQAKEG